MSSQQRKPNRLSEYHYSTAGFYFVTVCTKNRKECFGQIKDGKMILNECGEIARQTWLEISDHFEEIKLDEHVIMPNHVHGIIVINADDDVGAAYMRSLPQDLSKMQLSKIVQQYKSAVTRQINHVQNEFRFKWQKSFYDHIIRNDKSLHRIRKYIRYNTLKWQYDRENKNNIPLVQKRRFWREFLTHGFRNIENRHKG